MGSEAARELKTCPNCGEAAGWKNPAVRCLDCAREYCPSCPDVRTGWMSRLCPDCGSSRARIL